MIQQARRLTMRNCILYVLPHRAEITVMKKWKNGAITIVNTNGFNFTPWAPSGVSGLFHLKQFQIPSILVFDHNSQIRQLS